MKTPSILHVLMCFLDIVFNGLLIFPERTIALGDWGNISIPGAGLGIVGAALGTLCAEAVSAVFMVYFLLIKSELLHIRKEPFHLSVDRMKKALYISIPVGMENLVMCAAYIAATKIVAPLGMVAIAANSFAVTAESLCYMPGYGIGSAATTLIGQSVGAGRKNLTKRLGWLATFVGMGVMALSGALMFVIAPWMIGLLSPDPAIRELGTQILRIEAFAEPLYAASIVITGVFRGLGETLLSTVLNFASMWMVRIPLMAFLAPRMGLRGVWIGMATELCVRGLLFIIRLVKRR